MLLVCILHAGCFEPVTSLSVFRKKHLQNDFSVAGFTAASFPEETPSLVDAELDYLPLVQRYSGQYHFDWVLIMSVIRQESGFKSDAVSNKGAYGLMQIMPTTESTLKWQLGVKETRTPDNNVRAGIFHLRSLYHIFRETDRDNRIRLALAAYNGGISRVLDARQIAAYLGHNPSRWDSVRDALPLLSRRYHTLHQGLWQQDRPPNGYFEGWKETVRYVDRIMRYYENSVGTMAYTNAIVPETKEQERTKRGFLAAVRQGGQVSD